MGTGYDVWFTDDAADFLDRAGRVLTADPVTGTVVGSMAHRIALHGMPDGLPDGWFAVVTGPDGDIAGIAMRTAPYDPWPPYLLAMPDEAADALARAVLARGQSVAGANGLRPATDRFATTVAALTGRRAEVHLHHRLFELGTLVDPRPVPGRLRAVRVDEAETALAWIHQFFRDADEQAGREIGHLSEASGFGIGDVHRKIGEGVLWFWTDGEDRPVHLTGVNPPAYGVTRIGPVYTPKEERGRGWAAAAVAEVSRLLRSRGERAILFTDQANPTSNALYQALGYEPVVDTAQFGIA
ncbi:GNAT family N-acetyltransferase [Nocardioides aromaticivorans]|uniref:GNAT family N-acetyltransferase n=1 Tax=Nocardioides aromaticivorans TaxID=200618 RepID=A0ABX7PIL3_9ACTN|nr:GNAT family N-acetyltransferase [Nocardioides aromaticivorans]QSR25597.1 GNAT family N-acetyltransferase [Nocardioides aromaticivorans]